MIAVGIYLRKLRNEYIGGRRKLATQLRVARSQIERVEGGQNSHPPFLFQVMRAVHGDPSHIDVLLAQDDEAEQIILEEVAEALARRRIRTLGKDPSDYERRREDVEQLVAELISHPRKFDQWIGWGRRLLEEPDRTS